MRGKKAKEIRKYLKEKQLPWRAFKTIYRRMKKAYAKS